jgi:hypothetical protein
MLTHDEVASLGRIAALLLPGDQQSPSAESIPNLDQLIQNAAVALGREIELLRAALTQVPEVITWDSLKSFAASDPDDFEIIAVTAAGAYFMAPEALRAIGYPQANRKAARLEQAADEIGTGVLDQVMARQSMYREVSA